MQTTYFESILGTILVQIGAPGRSKIQKMQFFGPILRAIGPPIFSGNCAAVWVLDTFDPNSPCNRTAECIRAHAENSRPYGTLGIFSLKKKVQKNTFFFGG